MRLLTWNIQCGKGCDGVTDLARIVSVAKELADADVYCFQEVSDNFANLDGGDDQSAQLASLLPGYVPVFRPAIESIDNDGRTHRFGNMTLSRLPVMQISNHLLPWPGASAVRSMRRHALDVTVQTAFGALRVVNTHLEYHSADQREAQIKRLLDLQEEASTSAKASGSYNEPYAAQTLAASSLLCGDFNFDVSDPQHALINESARAGLNYRDAWSTCHPGQPHAMTCGLYDRVQWSDGPDCRDFIFTTEDLSGRIRHIEVDAKTAASDHQPIFIEFAD
ncbi:endonuclease/exonuclease/phosphatase family metal-dependent hydrolase [Afipia massiliensis]|uniref:Endonuclease/exonuclease/phosphatase family metal-dependent hydrolase n=1 Tax=Afipia massiliensis TaxID=211460 RepID=A0A840MSS4_9BRAD|nr:endonuclease/exonuclease/phosphatase family protein [Afipia massiliensis]MBB5050835.1 endonuclease/exonuclease/phosphatase family metal-dependent hydrolase [Afipia massiliensis]